ncbi:MAG: hypothetical protein WCW02_04155 [Candidatus Buchananbacteria bacterium]
MDWQEEEIKKRIAPDYEANSHKNNMNLLWQKFNALNERLDPKLRLELKKTNFGCRLALRGSGSDVGLGCIAFLEKPFAACRAYTILAYCLPINYSAAEEKYEFTHGGSRRLFTLNDEEVINLILRAAVTRDDTILSNKYSPPDKPKPAPVSFFESLKNIFK